MSFDFDELKHKAGNMLEKGKEKAHEAAESEKGQKIKSKAGELFEKGKEKAHEFAESETGKKVKNKAEKLLADNVHAVLFAVCFDNIVKFLDYIDLFALCGKIFNYLNWHWVYDTEFEI